MLGFTLGSTQPTSASSLIYWVARIVQRPQLWKKRKKSTQHFSLDALLLAKAIDIDSVRVAASAEI